MNRTCRQIILALLLALSMISAPLLRVRAAVSATAVVTSVSVSALTLNNWQYGGTTATLKIWADVPFYTSDGTPVLGGQVGSPKSVYQAITCTVSGTNLTIPSFSLPSTTDSIDVPTATYTAILYDASGTRRDTLAANFRLPPTANQSWANIRQFNTAQPQSPTPTYWDSGSVIGYVNQKVAGLTNYSGADFLASNFASYTAAVNAMPASNTILAITTAQTATNQTTPTTLTQNFAGGAAAITVPNGVTLIIQGPIIAPLKQIFILQGTGVVSFAGNKSIQTLYPEWWGAKGDKVADDSTAINAALTAAGTVTNGATVSLSATSYLCASGLTVPSNVKLAGQGRTVSELFFQNAAGIATGIGINSGSNIDIGNFKLTGSGTSTLSRGVYNVSGNNVRVHDLTVTGVTFSPVSGPQTAIGTVGGSNVWVTDNECSGNGIAAGPIAGSYEIINFNSNPAAQRIHFQRNYIHDSFCAYSMGMFDVSNSDMEDNTIDQNNKIAASATISSGYGIFVYQQLAPAPCDHVHVNRNNVRNTAGSGIYFAAATAIECIGNIVETTTQQQTGVLPQGGIALNSVNYGVVGPNVVLNSTKHGIILSGTPNAFNAVTGNSISAAAQDGLSLVGLSDSTVTGNTVDSPGNFCINILISSFRNIVGHNICRGAVFDGISITNDTGSVFANNAISNAQRRGILMTTNSNVRTKLLSNQINGTGLSNALYQGILAQGSGLEVSGNSISPYAGTVTGATNASPIVIATSFPHGLVTGQTNVTIAGVVTNTNANGMFTITVVDSTHFSLNGSAGNGVYGGGGTVSTLVTTNAMDTSAASDSNFHDNNITGTTNGVVLGGTRNLIKDNTLVGNTNPTIGALGTSILRGNRYTNGAMQGTAVLGAGGTITVNTTEVLTSDQVLRQIQLTSTLGSGTPGALSVGLITAGVSFVINSSSAADTSTVFWQIVH